MTRPGRALPRYVAAASLARLADGGGAIALILLAASQGGHGAVVGGAAVPDAALHGAVLAACLTAPHLLGPFVARRMDLAADPRKPIATACLLYAAALATAVATFGAVPFALSAVLVAMAGTCGPLLTGGLSSRLPALAAPAQRAQRRAQGWDAATYGIGASLGPAIVAIVASSTTPAAAALCLAGCAALAAVFVLRLPAPVAAGGSRGDVPTALETITLILRDGDLRRTLAFTTLVAGSVAALPVAALGAAARFQLDPAAAAVLAASYGIGYLLGSGIVLAFPLRGEPRRIMPVLAAALALALAATAASPAFAVSVAAYAVAGALNALFMAATLAARSEYAPAAARGQVFIWVAALKISSASAGTFLAGLLAPVDSRLPLVAGAVSVAALTLGFGMPVRRIRVTRRHAQDARACATQTPPIHPATPLAD
ncbi:MFS transporter [Arthrobacter ginkgonis]|uniref:MFS transporter n=1 Tax=Arthrobacter ginkgonis TaxID=1630594 RepID=A0ABP7BTF6_9MICC